MPTRTALTLSELATALASTSDDSLRLRMVLDFVDGCAESPVSDRAALIADEPARVDDRWDAFLAALADHVTYENDFRQPPWVEAPHRFLRRFWFPVNLPSVIPDALANSPATFMRHGVLITPDLFSRG